MSVSVGHGDSSMRPAQELVGVSGSPPSTWESLIKGVKFAGSSYC